MKKNLQKISLLFLLVAFALSGCTKKEVIDYSVQTNWVYSETDASQKAADVFFICPTVYGGTADSFNMEMSDDETKKNFLGATNMEKGIYDENARFFAPYYRQVGLNVYSLPEKERAPYLKIAYSDIKSAFKYYLAQENDNRPIILAGFSQGAELCIRLLKDFSKDEQFMNRFVACYAIGWRITEEEMKANPNLKFATGSSDCGVIVSFNSEAENVDDSLMIPKGTKTLSINPLNWRTDGTPVDRSLNKGACFTDYNGNIVTEIPALTGAYIDQLRGALKVTDVTPEDYPPVLDIFQEGIYHLYDYQFFYRNLQENVKERIQTYESK